MGLLRDRMEWWHLGDGCCKKRAMNPRGATTNAGGSSFFSAPVVVGGVIRSMRSIRFRTAIGRPSGRSAPSKCDLPSRDAGRNDWVRRIERMGRTLTDDSTAQSGAPRGAPDALDHRRFL